MTTTAQKLKLLYLAEIFERETDEKHGLTGPDLISKLAERGVDVERKTLYRDIDCLREFGYDIVKYQRSKPEWGLASRDFQDGELLLLADAVQSSKFLSKRKSEALVKSLGKLASKHLADDLRRRVHVEGRIKTQNESVFYNIDAIQRAMTAKRKISFRYFKHDEMKRRILQHDGELYLETPVQLVYMDDCYYVVVWNDKHEGFANYRVDRMLDIDVAEEEATKNDQIATFDVGKYQQRVFNMFNGDAVAVTLRVKSSAMSSVLDRFGKDLLVTKAADGVATACVTVMEAPTFYGWLTQFGEDVMIQGPDKIRDGYLDYLAGIADAYRLQTAQS